MRESTIHRVHRRRLIIELVDKVNVKSGLIACCFLLCVLGIWMCSNELKASGSIDVNAFFFKGKMTTGSVGLVVIFLAIPLAALATRLSLCERHVELAHRGMHIKASNVNPADLRQITNCLIQYEELHSQRLVEDSESA